MKLYIYADLMNQVISHSSHNYWRETDLYKTDYSCWQLLETRDIEWEGEFDFVSGKIKALEMKLGDLQVQSNNIKEQIQELLCIGHDNSVKSPSQPPDLNDPIDLPFPF